MMRILRLDNKKELGALMQRIGVDPYGVRIMSAKGIFYTVKLSAVSNIAGNIIKQEMLSLGGDAAIARGSLTGAVKKTDCLIMGTAAQLDALCIKLKHQPFGLSLIGRDLAQSLAGYDKCSFIWNLPTGALKLGERTRVMGIINITPDSFSADGFLRSGERLDMLRLLEAAQAMVRDGADIIDIGGESSRPGAKPLSVREELKRVIPAIRFLAKKLRVPVSVDTYKPQVAEAAIEAGAAIINDICGLRNSAMRKVVRRSKAGVIMMHMRANPLSMQRHPAYLSVVDDIIDYFRQALIQTDAAGIARTNIVIDPGIGFGKNLEHNLLLLRRLRDFKVLALPVMVGTSRKAFIGTLLNAPVSERMHGTLASCVYASMQGASIVRVHDVRETVEALKISQAIKTAAA